MPFTVRTVPVQAGGKAGTAYQLEADGSSAEVWPSHGFNCLRWRMPKPDGTLADLLYVAPDWDANPVPTRSGHPVLFPFPNRLLHGQLPFQGTTHQLAKNENTGVHAIHGFTPRAAWRVVDSGTDASSAFVTGEFQISKDAPSTAVWPADGRLRLTYRLTPVGLRLEAEVDAPDGKPMPFGLGYHPYFRLPTDAPNVDGYTVQASAGELWELAANMPTGTKTPATGELDFQTGRTLGATVLDHLYTAVRPTGTDEVASIAVPGGGKLSIHAGGPWRELLLFTPPHRQAVAIEPYTCATDAANLEAKGLSAGWRVLAPGERFAAAVEYRWQPNF